MSASVAISAASRQSVSVRHERKRRDQRDVAATCIGWYYRFDAVSAQRRDRRGVAASRYLARHQRSIAELAAAIDAHYDDSVFAPSSGAPNARAVKVGSQAPPARGAISAARQREMHAAGGVAKRRSGEAAQSCAGTTWSAAPVGGASTPFHAAARVPHRGVQLACSRCAERWRGTRVTCERARRA